MASHFIATTCRIEGDAYVSSLVWSKIEGIAAVAASIVDDNDRETHQVCFMNNEVTSMPQRMGLPRRIYLPPTSDAF